ncbi:hypothetical protein OMW55_04115 [Sphingomonas sp. BN140010]|uniref:AAA family ATPase n=1 Tax=Sphingomonas arvum TaxID=2992113 RepID=A0ABT3JDZ7_9SPHN|nr:shikimate kinase [Sphingomonas sp. BN140010]MCW3796990.1 hypothetical protein [Sphingomonas sp. BN140010]
MGAPPPQVHGEPLTLVELFALPGAGKSTVSDAVAAKVQVKTRHELSAEWAATPRSARAAQIGRSLASRKRLAAAVRFAIRARLNTRESLFRLGRLVAKTEWLKSRSGLVLLDQGLLQDIWSIVVSRRAPAIADQALLRDLIRAMYDGINATIVQVEVDSQTASARIAARTYGSSRFDRLPQSQLRGSIEKTSAIERDVVEAARLAGMPVHVVDGSAPVPVVADRLLSFLPVGLGEGSSATPLAQRRISIVGASGSGKTTLGRQVAERLGLPFWELDEERRAVEYHAARECFRDRIADLARGNSWVIDGHYRDVRDLIWSRADVVVWLNLPLHVVAKRLIGRYRRKRMALSSQPRPGEPPLSAATQLSSASWRRRLARLIKTLRERNLYRRLLRSDHPELRVVELRSPEAARWWLEKLGA